MKIYVHSSGRPNIDVQTTLQELPTSWLSNTELVVQKSEMRAYRSVAAHFGIEMMVLPSKIKTLSPTRQYILENSSDEKFVLMDDDLRFYKYKVGSDGLYEDSDGASTGAMLMAIEDKLNDYAHVGVAAREGANRLARGGVEVTRMMRVLAYRLIVVTMVGARFDRVPTKQDFDMTLQLLRAGYKNYVLTDWCQNQGRSDAPGGCSAYRTAAMGAVVSEELAKLHKPFVKVVQRVTKGAWGGGERTDVMVYWKKAYQSATAKWELPK